MEAELPSITYQRRKLFRPNPADVIYTYNIINRHVFKNQLRRPEITLSRMATTWGVCRWHEFEQNSGTSCDLALSDKWFCKQWFVNTLAHEMVHQWQWDIYRWDHQDYFGRDIHQQSGAHGPSFFVWRDEFDYYGLNLKSWFRMKKWFAYQDFHKC